MSSSIKNIYMVGVGGQGILLASEILAEALMLAGYDVKKAEVHGMAQRGGSVVSHVRYGKKVYSPVIPEGEGDVLFGFELLESYRYLPLLRREGRVVVNNLKIQPPSVALGRELYPADLPAKICQAFPGSLVINGLEKALEAGSSKTINTVLLGTLSHTLDIDLKHWRQAIENMVPGKFLKENLKAFELGRAG